MADKKISWWLSLLEIIIQSTAFFGMTIAVVLGIMQRPAAEFIICLLVVPLVVLFYIIRRNIWKFNVFIALHIPLFLIGPVFGADDTQKCFLFLLGAALAVYSIRLKAISIKKQDISEVPIQDEILYSDENKEEEKIRLQVSEKMPFAFCAVFVLGYMAGHAYNSNTIMNTEVILFILFVLFQVLYNDLKSIKLVYLQNGKRKEFPAEQLRRVNGFIIGTTLILMFGAMLLFYKGEYGNIFEIAGNAFKMLGVTLLPYIKLIIKVIFGFFSKLSGNNTESYQETTAASDEDTVLGIEEFYTTPPMVEAAAEALGMLLIIAALAGMVYLLIRYAKNFDHTKKKNTDYIEHIQRLDRKERQHIKQSKKNKQNVGEKQKSIRKLYKKHVLRGAGEAKPDKTLIPMDLTRQTITEQEELAASITDIYEKARYSNQEIKQEEIRKFKEILDRLK